VRCSSCTVLNNANGHAAAPSPNFSVYTPRPPTPNPPCNPLNVAALSPFCITESPSNAYTEHQPSVLASSVLTSLWIQRLSTPFTGHSPAPLQSTDVLEHLRDDASDSPGSGAGSQSLGEISSAEISSQNSTKGPTNSDVISLLDAISLEKSLTAHNLEDALAPNQEVRCYQEEEAGCRKRLLVLKFQHGPDHLEVLEEMQQLALVFLDQGRFKPAESLLCHIADARQKVLGSSNLTTVDAFYNLARAFLSQGRYEIAEKLQRHVLMVRKENLGNEHESTVFTKASLALILWHQERYAEAANILYEVWYIAKKIWGHEHPQVLRAEVELVSLFWSQGRLREAETMGRRIWLIQKKVLGDDHPATSSTQTILDALSEKLGPSY
jgi:hypothetical protein